jgi:hypothetical protein
MIAAYYGKVSSDQEYNAVRARYGDTTIAQSHVQALRALGLRPRYVTNGNAALLERELASSRPVAVGWLHRGTPASPSGGGHWSVVVGATASAFLHHDPRGEADLVHGGFVNYDAAIAVPYSRKRWLPRWEVDGASTGWCMCVTG